MFELLNIPDQAIGSVYAAWIVAIASFVTVILTFIVKDYWIPIWLEKNKTARDNKRFFLKYKTPLLEATDALSYRLGEIFSNRSFFLLKDAPQTEFYKYKYISTIYRLCSVIGWIRAVKLESINIVMPTIELNRTLEDSINEFNKSLADGQHIELAVIKNVCNTWDLDISKLSEKQLKDLGCELDDIMQEFFYNYKKELASDLEIVVQQELMLRIRGKIYLAIGMDKSDSNLPNLSLVIKEVSIKQALIYRDWQQAIGDLMIKKSEATLRMYDVIGFKEFENIYTNGSEEQKLWIKRIERLFAGVDIKIIEEKFDSRISQLKNINLSAINLKRALAKVENN